MGLLVDEIYFYNFEIMFLFGSWMLKILLEFIFTVYSNSWILIISNIFEKCLYIIIIF